jgi:hypothetical protein
MNTTAHFNGSDGTAYTRLFFCLAQLQRPKRCIPRLLWPGNIPTTWHYGCVCYGPWLHIHLCFEVDVLSRMTQCPISFTWIVAWCQTFYQANLGQIVTKPAILPGGVCHRGVVPDSAATNFCRQPHHTHCALSRNGGKIFLTFWQFRSKYTNIKLM